MQRLPSHRIQRADELSEIGLEEDPAPSGLRPRDEAALRPRADLFRVHVEECGGFIEIESLHATVSFEVDLIIGQAAEEVSQGMRRVSAETWTPEAPAWEWAEFLPKRGRYSDRFANAMRHIAHRPGARARFADTGCDLKGANLHRLNPMP